LLICITGCHYFPKGRVIPRISMGTKQHYGFWPKSRLLGIFFFMDVAVESRE
jgi:hypothetical protein